MDIIRDHVKLPTARWLGMIVALTLTTMIGTHIYLVKEEHERLLTKSAEAQRNLVDSLAGHVQATLEKADLLSQRLTDDLATSPERVSQLAYHETLASTIDKNRDFDSALLIKRDGSVASSSISANSPTSNFSDRDYFNYHRTHSDTSLVIGKPVVSRMSGRRVIPMTRRVNDHQGAFVGVVAITFSIDALHREFTQYHHGEDRFFALANLDGTVLVRHPRLESASGLNIRNSEQYTEHYLKHSYGSFTTSSPLDHVIRRYYYRNLSGYPLLVVEGINENTILDEVLPAIRIKSVLLGSITLVVALLTLYLFRQLQATKVAENGSRIAMAKMYAFQSALDDYVIAALLDRDGKVVDANDRFCNLSAFSREELIGRRLPMLDGRIDDPGFASTLMRALSTGSVWRGTRLAHNKCGETFWLQSCVLPVGSAPDERQLFLLAQTDITAVKNAQQQTAEVNQALSQTLALNLAILNSTRCGIFATDDTGSIVLFNAAAEQLLGYQRGEVVDRLSPWRFLDPDAVQMMLRASDTTGVTTPMSYPEGIPSATNANHAEWRWMRRDGSPILVSVTTMPVLDADNSVRGYVTVFDDLSEQKKLDAMKSDFVSVVSHELRTPLTSIKGSLSLLKSTLTETLDERKMRLLDIGIDNCEKLVRLVSDILDIDKLSRGQMSLICATQPLVPVIENAISMNAPYAAQLDVRFEFHPPTDIGVVNIDDDRMLQVLTNLLSNAAKFSSAGQVVTIFVEQTEDAVTVGVRDRGAGIPEAFKDKVFDRFTQSGSVTTKHKPGSGLGLTIAKSLVELQGGTLSFESEEGAGTTFYVRLPQASVVLQKTARRPFERVNIAIHPTPGTAIPPGGCQWLPAHEDCPSERRRR